MNNDERDLYICHFQKPHACWQTMLHSSAGWRSTTLWNDGFCIHTFAPTCIRLPFKSTKCMKKITNKNNNSLSKMYIWKDLREMCMCLQMPIQEGRASTWGQRTWLFPCLAATTKLPTKYGWGLDLMVCLTCIPFVDWFTR